MKTAIFQAIEELEKEPLLMVSQKCIAAWLQACYAKIEKQQLIDAINSNTVECEHYDSHVWKYKDGEQYYTTTYKQ